MNNRFKNMDKERKTALIVLGVFSLIIVVALFLNLRNSIRGPLDYKKLASKDQKATTTVKNSDELSSDNLELKNKDTDKDSLTDWDELFIYATSPYLEDTDGDGLTDYEEIVTYKTNPTCPEGQTCSGTLTQGDSQNVISNESELGSLYDVLSGLDEMGEEINTSTATSTIATSSTDINPAQLRSLLLENGFSQEDLNAVSDEDLLKIYSQVSTEF